MNYGIVLYFDEISKKQIHCIRQSLSSNGITIDLDVEPHISLAIYSDIEELTLIEKIKTFSKQNTTFNLKLLYLGIFPTDESVIFLAPKATSELLSFHSNLLNYMSEYKNNLNPYYDVDLWVPHCTLGINLPESELLNAVKLLKKENILPITVSFEKISVLTFPPIKQIFVTNFNSYDKRSDLL